MKSIFEIKGVKFGAGKPVVCVPIVEQTAEGICREAEELAAVGIDMVEWRVDHYEDIADPKAVKSLTERLGEIFKATVFLFSIRTVHQGGNADLTESEIARLNEIAADTGVVDMIDVEFFEVSKPVKQLRRLQRKGVRVIASHHDFEKTPVDEVLHMLMEQMHEGGADIAKLAVYPQNVDDVIRMLKLSNDTKQLYPDFPIITISMGSLGILTRVSGELTGSIITFGMDKKGSAPGQMPVDELQQVLDILHEYAYPKNQAGSPKNEG